MKNLTNKEHFSGGYIIIRQNIILAALIRRPLITSQAIF